MNSTRKARSLIANSALISCLALARCGGETGSGGGAVVAPAPSVVAPQPVPQPVPVPSVVASAPSAVPSASPVAQPPLNPQGAEQAEGDDHRDQHYGGVPMLIALSVKDLDLSADQRTAVDKIRADLFAKMEPARAAGKDLSSLLADGVAAGSVDRAKADAAINKLVTQVQGLHEASLGALNQLHAALNAQQRTALIDDVQSHWEKWKEAHGRDEGDDHQHHPGFLLALVRQLGLSKDQAEKIKANFHERMTAAPQDHGHKEVQDHLKAFATAFKAETFNAKTLASAKAANGHMAKWGATRRARFLEAAAPVLTPEQRTKLADAIRSRAGGLS
jgi:Spy/CpxP family protein refolding chaperone